MNVPIAPRSPATAAKARANGALVLAGFTLLVLVPLHLLVTVFNGTVDDRIEEPWRTTLIGSWWLGTVLGLVGPIAAIALAFAAHNDRPTAGRAASLTAVAALLGIVGALVIAANYSPGAYWYSGR